MEKQITRIDTIAQDVLIARTLVAEIGQLGLRLRDINQLEMVDDQLRGDIEYIKAIARAQLNYAAEEPVQPEQFFFSLLVQHGLIRDLGYEIPELGQYSVVNLKKTDSSSNSSLLTHTECNGRRLVCKSMDAHLLKKLHSYFQKFSWFQTKIHIQKDGFTVLEIENL